jgi:hypothetical protein
VLNSFTGNVWINGMPPGPIDTGRIRLGTGQDIKTKDGMAELLLTPGSFLRIGNQSDLTLESVEASGVRLRLLSGEALMEVLDAQPSILVEQSGSVALLQRPGLYGFDARRNEMSVYVGEARLSRNGIHNTIAADHGVKLHSLREFPAKPIPSNALWAWSNLRSKQLSGESAASAQAIGMNSGERRSSSWFWDVWAGSYTWLSASGAVTGPFGWPYYSPGYTPNSIPVHQGDSYLYGPPANRAPGIAQPAAPDYGRSPAAVPLTAPGVPQFPNNRF